MVAMALAGFNEEKAGLLWREMATSLVRRLHHPYLRAMFEFLLIMSQWNGSDQETFRYDQENYHRAQWSSS